MAENARHPAEMVAGRARIPHSDRNQQKKIWNANHCVVCHVFRRGFPDGFRADG
jgi:nitrate reductase cytochrome c-type subunit